MLTFPKAIVVLVTLSDVRVQRLGLYRGVCVLKLVESLLRNDVNVAKRIKRIANVVALKELLVFCGLIDLSLF